MVAERVRDDGETTLDGIHNEKHRQTPVSCLVLAAVLLSRANRRRMWNEHETTGTQKRWDPCYGRIIEQPNSQCNDSANKLDNVAPDVERLVVQLENGFDCLGNAVSRAVVVQDAPAFATTQPVQEHYLMKVFSESHLSWNSGWTASRGARKAMCAAR